MPEQLFLSEYVSGDRTAWVCRRRDLNDFVVIGYINGMERIGHPFATEQQADDYAEDWVLLTTSE
jgi:hypothetical protein